MDKGSLIEQAMRRQGEDATAAKEKIAPAGRREYDGAVIRRSEQLHAALGTATAGDAAPTPGPAKAAESGASADARGVKPVPSDPAVQMLPKFKPRSRPDGVRSLSELEAAFGRRGYETELLKRAGVIDPRGHRVPRLVAASVVSALLGAGAMYLVLTRHPAPRAAPGAATDAPAAMTATDANLSTIAPMLGASPRGPLAGAAVPLPAPPASATSPAPLTPSPTGPVVAAVEAIPAVVPALPPAADAAHLVRLLVERWRQAWSARDVAGYLAAYAADFAPADGSRRAAWEAARRKNLSGRRQIDVNVRELTLERVDETTFRVRFRQDYASGGYREQDTAKELTVRRADGQWRIVGERQLD